MNCHPPHSPFPQLVNFYSFMALGSSIVSSGHSSRLSDPFKLCHRLSSPMCLCFGQLSHEQFSQHIRHLCLTCTWASPAPVPHLHLCPTCTCAPPTPVPHLHLCPTCTCAPSAPGLHLHLGPTCTWAPPAPVPHLCLRVVME